jgi:asparagine synthase (glutamine-hydrolysing)
MCGIAGQLAFPTADERAVSRMRDALAHRGPDGDGFLHDGPIALAHRRLSIIDLAGGAQPIFNEDDSIAVVFNGEIYNYRELLDELRPRHQLRTQSDTEVLVHLYEELGVDMLARLRGMFAFALWDKRRRRLLLARDRFGEKPILYTHERGVLSFASEMPAIRAAAASTSEIDLEAVSAYLEVLYVPAPHTIFERIHKLPAGHYLLADERGVEVRRYYSPPRSGTRSTPPGRAPDLVRRVRTALEDAVRLQVRSDVPIAALLSGGIDSSAVVGLMAQELGPGVKTFSVGFGRDDDELPWARMVAERHRTEHHELMVTDDLLTQVAESFATFGEPFGDNSSVPTLAVCRAVAQHVKVVLTGDGGDELFAGYPRYRRVGRIPHFAPARLAAPVIERLPEFRLRSALRRGADVVGRRNAARNRALIEVFSPHERKQLLGRAIPALRAAPGGSDIDAAIEFDLDVYLPDDLLVKMDLSAMHWSLESRCPLLDHPVAELVVPPVSGEKQSRTEGKLLFKAAVADLLPDAILRRQKRGFGSPVDAWLRGPLRSLFIDLVRSPSARTKKWLDAAAVDRVVDGVLAGRRSGHQGWALLALEGWARRHHA